jgi:hypothetical protein
MRGSSPVGKRAIMATTGMRIILHTVEENVVAISISCCSRSVELLKWFEGGLLLWLYGATYIYSRMKDAYIW